MKLDLNPQFEAALHSLENDRRTVFITGEAGTGKSTLLQHFRYGTEQRLAVLAPTGVAAHNVDGQTIHSFFKFKPGTTAEEVPDIARKASKKQKAVIKNIAAIIIDEISMVRADLLDMIDLYLRRILKKENPFGGKRMIMIGDLYQLPPVVTRDEREALGQLYTSPYFFSANVIKNMLRSDPSSFQIIELQTVYRQTEPEFVNLLNAIRARTCTEADVAKLNERVTAIHDIPPKPPYMYLTVRNDQAEEVNNRNLEQLPGSGITYWAEVTGEVKKNEFPAPETIELKVGARVMLTNNDRQNRWINGSLGTVSELGVDWIKVALDQGGEYEVRPVAWEVYATSYDAEKKVLTREVTGSFSQIPVVLAWAITVHKSQGKTFDRVVVDLGSGAFAEGQVYVALSRCRSLGGLYLIRPVRLRDIWINPLVTRFLEWIRQASSKQKASPRKTE